MDADLASIASGFRVRQDRRRRPHLEQVRKQLDFFSSVFRFALLHYCNTSGGGGGSGDWPYKPLFASSLDGGCSWVLHAIPDNMFDHFSTPYFLTADRGWLPGAYLGRLISTNDGGATWKAIVAQVREKNEALTPGVILSVYFASESHGWILTFRRTNEFPIYATLDSGKTWNRETAAEFLDDYRRATNRSLRQWDVWTRIAFLSQMGLIRK
jgi:hypothetical protein